jgi:RimJ/RimL family protein N-acetyltransferase
MSSDLLPTLENNWIFIRPMRDEDFEPLRLVASDPLIWEQHPEDRYKPEVFTAFFHEAMSTGGALIIIDKQTNEIIGTSRYRAASGVDNAVEIGWTFLARKYWGGHYNGMIKSLMIDHAFQFYNDIIFHIHHLNIRSQRSVEKLGARRTHDPRLLKPNPEVDWTFVISRGGWRKGE